MNTIKIYTDHESVAILRRKTGSKDPESDWAKAWATQMLAQIKLGRDIDANNSLLEPTFEDVEKKARHHQFFRTGSFFVTKITLCLALVVQAIKVAFTEDNTALQLTQRLEGC
jgi:hypothetical protein